MAGGKETPRQKMIGMMYLVLTALLALNVSKQILDAFVAIEENSQNAASKSKVVGDAGISDLKAALLEKTDPTAKKRVKDLLVIADRIDKMTIKQVKQIDDAKMELLKYAGEDVTTMKDGDLETILWTKTDKCTPARLNLFAIKNKEEYDKPMELLIGAGADIKSPNKSALGMKIFSSIANYRCDLVSELGTWSSGEKKFYLRAKSINNFKDQNDLSRQIDKMFRISKINPDELDDLREIYSDLSLQERVNAGEIKDVHWIGRTFDHSPLVAALASLTSLEQSVLSARADAISMLKERAGTGEYSFNKVMALSYGPAYVNQNEDYEVKVLMAAYDSDNNPIVTGASETKDGVAYVRGKASGSEVNLSGTISIRKKDGSMKTQSWQNKIVVMKPQGTISLPMLNVLYKGYDNVVEGVASGYDQTILNGSNVILTKKGNQWIAKPANVKTASISISGKSSATGKTVRLGTYEFKVKQLPTPELYLGNTRNGEVFNPTSNRLFAKNDPNSPLIVPYKIIDYELTISGQNKPCRGQGSILGTDAINYLKQVKPGSFCTITSWYQFPNGDRAKVTGTFKR
ncbi:MAG: hypothetical protein ACK46Y_06850 [Fluviicola sp.]